MLSAFAPGAWGQASGVSYGPKDVEAGSTATSGGTASTSNSVARTGSQSVKFDPVTNSNREWYNNNIGIYPNATSGLVHIIYWAKADVTATTLTSTPGIRYNAYPTTGAGSTGGLASGNTAITINSSTWTRLSGTYAPTNASRYYFARIFFQTSTLPGNGYFDDIIMYYTAGSDATDLAKPNAPQNSAASGGSVTWTNGTDVGSGTSGANATGVQGTIVLTTTNPNATAPTLLDQGYYPTGTVVSTDWTVATSAASATTSYTVAGSPAKVALVHFDKAYNYSTAATVSVTPCSTPTLGSVSQAADICSGKTATINLTGLVASTTSIVSYNIGGGATQTASVTSDASGNGSFTLALTSASNGLSLTVTKIASGSCTANFNSSATLTVNALPTAPTGATGAARCGTGSADLSVADPGAGYTIDWYAAATGGTALSSSTPTFSTPSISTSTTYYAETRNTTTGCVSQARTAVTATVNGTPTISPTNVNVAAGATSASLSYTTTNSPNQYSITYDATAQAVGFVTVATTALTSSPLTLAIPAAATPATYNGTITVTNSTTGCSSTTGFTVTVVGPYTWTGGTDNLLATPGNWSPARNTAATSDVLVFDGATVPTATVSIGSSSTIANLFVKNGASVTFTTSALSVTNGISVESGSSMTQATGANMTVGGSSSIAGTYTLSSGNFITTGSIVTVTGTFNNASTSTTAITSSGATLLFSSPSGLGTYNLTAPLTGSSSGQIPVATWTSASGNGTLKISGVTTATALGAVGTPAGGSFGNIEIDLPALTSSGFKVFGAVGAFSSGMTIAGNLTLGRTNTGATQMTSGTPFTINIGGNLNVYAGNWNLMPFSGSNGAATLIIAGDVNIDGTVAYPATGYSRPVFTLTNARSGNSGSLSIGGSLYLNSGASIAELTQSSGTATLTFTGTGNKTLTQLNGSVISGVIGMNMNKTGGGSLALASDFASTGTLNVTLTAGTLNTGTHALTLTGTITPGTGIIDATAGTIIMKGSGGQTVPAGIFTNGTVAHFTANSGGTVTLASDLTISDALTLSTGTLSIGGNTLTLNGAATATSGTLSSTAAGTVFYNQGSNGQAVLVANYGNLHFNEFDKTLPAGTVSIAGTFTPGASIGHTVAGNTIRFNGSGAQSVPSFPYEGLQTATGGSKTLAANVVLTGDLTIGSSTTLTGGNFDLSVGGNWNEAGSFAPGTGTVTFNGTGNQVFTSAAGSSFYNMVVDKASGALDIASLANILQHIALRNGSVTSSSNLVLADLAKVTREGGSLDAAPNFLGRVDIEYTNGTDLASGAEVPAANIVRHFSISGGGKVTLDKAVTVNGTLALTSGIVDLTGFNLTANAGAVNGGSAASYIRTSGAGALILKNVPNSATLFPVGNSTYNPADVAAPAPQDWSVRVEDGISGVVAPYTLNVNKAVSRQWEVHPAVIPIRAPGATISFYYDGGSDVGNTFNAGMDVKVWHYLNGAWQQAADAQTPVAVGALKKVTAAGQAYFSPFAISNIDAPLPVSLMAFSGKRSGNSNELKWTTASESGNRGFGIERSTDGRIYTTVGFVATRAAGGNSNSVLTYTFTDANASGRKWYYRLKQEDLDGRAKLSSVVVLSADKGGSIAVDAVYPNPAKGAVSVRLQGGSKAGNVVLQLSDMQGRTVKAKPVSVDAGTSINATLSLDGLSAGQYHLKALGADGSVSETITIVKQ